MTRLLASLRAFWFGLWIVNEPWEIADIDVTRPAVKRMIARARLDRRREAGAMICWTYSRDRIVEQRERRLAQRHEASAAVLPFPRKVG